MHFMFKTNYYNKRENAYERILMIRPEVKDARTMESLNIRKLSVGPISEYKGSQLEKNRCIQVLWKKENDSPYVENDMPKIYELLEENNYEISREVHHESMNCDEESEFLFMIKKRAP